MGVHIDKTGAQSQALAVDGFVGRQRKCVAYARNAITLEKNVASPCACASAINENGVAQQGFFHVYFQEADDFVLLLSKVN